MNFLTDSIRPIYFKYLTAAFGSALISSIYGVVDAAMVGQYQGPPARPRWRWWRRCGTSFTPGPAHRHRRQRAVQPPWLSLWESCHRR